MKKLLFYPASEVKPIRTGAASIIRSLHIGEAVNLPLDDRNTYMSTITRLQKKSLGRWKTVKISNEEFALIRLS